MELNDKIIDRLKKRNLHEEKRVLRDIAQKSIHAKRRNPEQEDYRSKFSHDADRILHSLSYARYYDKTQVFLWIDSDVHQRRMHHVHVVAKMSRDIAQVL